MLEGRDDVYLQNQLQSIETNYNGDKVRYDTVSRTIWMRYDHTVDCKTLRSKLTNLKNNPLQFMRTYPVLPDHGRILDGSDIDYDLVTIDGTGNDTLIHRMLLTPSGANEYAFKLAYAPTSKQSQGTPIYFLPWQSARIVRMTLGAASNLFFTAAINGCSVFVEGPANAPIVYHAGINPPWPNMNNTVSAHVRRAKNANNVELTWRELFWDKSAVARNAVNFGEVNKTHYVADGTMTGEMKQQHEQMLITTTFEIHGVMRILILSHVLRGVVFLEYAILVMETGLFIYNKTRHWSILLQMVKDMERHAYSDLPKFIQLPSNITPHYSMPILDPIRMICE